MDVKTTLHPSSSGIHPHRHHYREASIPRSILRSTSVIGNALALLPTSILRRDPSIASAIHHARLRINFCLAAAVDPPREGAERICRWTSMATMAAVLIKAECSVTSERSPNGCYFMTATTAPRLQIDNCIKIFHHNGSLFFKKMFDKLYQAEWKPESPERFCEVAELIKSVDSLKVEERKPQGQTAKSSQNSAKVTSINMPAQKPAAYRPPQAKNAAAVQAELFGESSSETLSKNALRNRKKREKQREKKAAEAGSAPSDS